MLECFDVIINASLLNIIDTIKISSLLISQKYFIHYARQIEKKNIIFSDIAKYIKKIVLDKLRGYRLTDAARDFIYVPLSFCWYNNSDLRGYEGIFTQYKMPPLVTPSGVWSTQFCIWIDWFCLLFVMPLSLSKENINYLIPG